MKGPEIGHGPGVPLDRSFPEREVDALAAMEAFNKHLYRPNTYLHKWWARRSGTTFRAILKQLVTDEDRRDFYAAGGLEGRVILDPMMGGGTTLHEAIRLGANVIGVDVDPIPVVQARASMRLASSGRKTPVFQAFLHALRERLAPLYRTSCPSCTKDAEVQFVLYGLRRRCACGEAILLDSLTLREDHSGSRVLLCASCARVRAVTACDCVPTESPRLLTKSQSLCRACREPFRDLLDDPFPRRYVPLVVAGTCRLHGPFLRAVDASDLALVELAASQAAGLDFGDAAWFRVPCGPKSDDLISKGVRSFLELFTPRQLLYLHTALELLPSFAGEDRLWLALLVSTSLEFNSLLCGYKGAHARRPGAIRHVFSHHAYSFPYTALENNPVFAAPTSGTLRRLFSDRIVKAQRWALSPVERRLANGKAAVVPIPGEVDGGEEVRTFAALRTGTRKLAISQADARRLPLPDGAVDYIITDPPYFDSVQYSDLSAFFRAWLGRFLPDEADWTFDRSASVVVEGRNGSFGRYAANMAAIWSECARLLKRPAGRLVFTFHHWSGPAWAELTISLKRARFVAVNCYVISSENPISVHIRDLRALKHDVIFVLAPSDSGASGAWPKPERIDVESSEAFCRSCGNAVGWFLGANLAEDAILAAWGEVLVSPAAGGSVLSDGEDGMLPNWKELLAAAEPRSTGLPATLGPARAPGWR